MRVVGTAPFQHIMGLLSFAQDCVRQKLCGKTLPDEFRSSLTEPQEDILQLLRRTIELGEGNSILIIGPHGCGKSALLNKAILSLRNDRDVCEDLTEIRLNGFMQTNDRLALEEITRQLNLQGAVQDKNFESFAEHLTYLLQALKAGNSSKSRPLIFVLEEFDLFAQHKNQTLLYNLFDLTQAGSAPMTVIGLTSRLDVMDLFEKRVKSRFSHRQIYIFNNDSFEEYVANFKNCLTLQDEFCQTSHVSKKEMKAFVLKWNTYIHRIVSDASVKRSLESQYNICQELPALYTILSLPLSKLNPANDHTSTCSAIVDQIAFSHGDEKANVMNGLTVLELCLVIAMNHVSNTYDEPFNFQMVYVEFLKFARRRSHSLQNHSKQVLMKAYEHLIELELLMPVDANATKSSVFSGCRSKLQKEYRLMQLLVKDSQLHTAVHKYTGCPTDVKQWALALSDIQ